ncbi:MAG: hypothetical protein WB493_15025 [Anaeromyxobacteraceae bacterium]
MTAAGAAAMASTLSEGARALWTLTLVLGGAALALVTLDTVPGWLHGEPRGVRRATSVEEAERRLQARVQLPSYFPDTLRWPPSSVRFTREDGGSVALSFLGADGAPALYLAQAVGKERPIAEGLVGRLAVIQQQSAPIEGDAVLARVVAEDGTLWSQLEWSRNGRRYLLRGRGSLEDLIRMARSIHGEAR